MGSHGCKWNEKSSCKRETNLDKIHEFIDTLKIIMSLISSNSSELVVYWLVVERCTRNLQFLGSISAHSLWCDILDACDQEKNNLILVAR